MENTNEIDGYMKKLISEKTGILEKRNKERQQNLETKHELNRKNAAESEGYELFQNNFQQQIRDIENILTGLKPGDREQLTIQFNDILNNIQNLQNYLTSSTLFLSNYTIKTCQTKINELKTKVESTKEKLLTKRKFGFRSKPETISVTKPETKAIISKPIYMPLNIDHLISTVEKKQNVEIVLEKDDVNEKDITISALSKCIIQIMGHPGSLRLSDLTDCIVLCGPVSRSVFADDCKNCKFAFGCQQLRLHTSNYCDIYMHVTCRAIIEDCSNINVAPYNYEYPDISDDFAKAKLDTDKNNWENVADFNWLSTDVNSPNWQKLDSSKRINDWRRYLEDFRTDHLIR